MDRRFFTKATLGLVAGGMVVASNADAQTKSKKKVATEYVNVDSDIANEQIKVIQSKRFYKNQGTKVEGKCTSLLFFADVHLVTPHLKQIRDFYNKYKKYIDDSVHLGDTVGDYIMGKFTFWDDFPNALNIIGNHDTDKGVNLRRAMTDREKYDTYFKRFIDSWKVTQPENADAEGKCYWYKDYNQDVRLIGIDCMRINDSQYKWFVETLDDAAKKNLKVLVATHVPPNCDKSIDCNFTSLDYPAPYNGQTKGTDKLLASIDAFIEKGGTFVSWICGHNHHDSVFYAKSKQKQLVLILECATDFSWWTDAVHVPKTATATCWEIISVESVSNVIKIARFGNNYDHYMRRKDTFCYDFKNHKLIWSS